HTKKQRKSGEKTKLKRFALPHTTNSVVIPPMPNLDCQSAVPPIPVRLFKKWSIRKKVS
ncbi:hypothetical protein BCR42DRAFT_424284, partial [Absidia repens]